MNAPCSTCFSAMRGAWGRVLAAPLGAALLALAACNGTAVVTLTSTASPDTFLAYRVGLVSLQLQGSSGKSGLTILPASTTVDFAKLTDVSEVLGAAAVAKGSYTSAVITLDYSSAQIVYDDGSIDGVALTPVGASGQALGQVQLTVNLDPSDSFSVSSNRASQLALAFNLAASDVVNLTGKTVTVTPLMAASAMPIDGKQVRIRGPLARVAGNSTAASTSFTMGIMPFTGTVSGAGQLAIAPSDPTIYEINGSESIGGVGLSQLAAASAGTLTVVYGTLNAVGTTATGGATSGTGSTNVSFAATQVLAGSSVQGGGLDRVSGIVSARSGNTLSVEDGTLVGADGSDTLIVGTTTVNMGANTLVTVFGENPVEFHSPQQVSVGSSIDAFGVATSQSLGNVTLDASAGRVRLGTTTASGLVTAQGSGILNLDLATLGGRAVAAFDFVGTGATPGQYGVSTGLLDLTNSTAGVPVIVTGIPNSFGAAPPDFTAATLLDPTTIQAELVVDWGAGTAAPFTTYDSSAIYLDIHNSSIGVRHQIQLGAQTIDIGGVSSDPLIVPDSSGSNAVVFAIGHSVSSTIENFNTYAAFIARLQAELNGTTLATGVTAVGQYTASTLSLTATSITLFLNN
jgi:fibronectin-binding autotransporter adhesin